MCIFVPMSLFYFKIFPKYSCKITHILALMIAFTRDFLLKAFIKVLIDERRKKILSQCSKRVNLYCVFSHELLELLVPRSWRYSSVIRVLV